MRRVKPATLRDYGALLREPGIPYKRRTRVTHGRLVGALGDRAIKQLRTREVSAFLRALDDEGLSARNVNKHRQELAAMFQYACREDTHGLEVNPGADKRPEPPPAALDYYEYHELQALADVTAAGAHRHGARDELDRRIDEQDAEFFWILFFTGLLLGEAVTLACSHCPISGRRNRHSSSDAMARPGQVVDGRGRNP